MNPESKKFTYTPVQLFYMDQMPFIYKQTPMIIYNVTIHVQSPIQSEWLSWLKEVHIPDMLETGCFTNARILRLLETDDSGGPTFAIQYDAESKALYNRYIENFSGIMQRKSIDKWGDQFLAFTTVLQVVN